MAFKNIYEVYCPVLQSIAFQICNNERQAKRILKLSFKKAYHQNTNWQKKEPFCIDLMKLVVQTAQEEIHKGSNQWIDRADQFKNVPLLYKILLEDISLKSYCEENSVTRQEVLQHIREECCWLREFQIHKSNAISI